MPHPPRYELAGVAQHVIQRGNNRQPTFFAAEDYQAYCGWLGEAAVHHGCSIHAYVLMTNHVHLLVTPQMARAIGGKLMQSLGRRYVQYVNARYQRSGTLWEGRYKASLRKYDDALYLGVEAGFELKSPTIMRNKQGGWLSKPGNDITVFHPRTKYVKNRPDWLGMDGYRHPYELTLRPMTSRTLTRGFVASEPAEAIPMDQMLVAAGETSVTLMLPNGEYRLVRQTEAGENLPLGEVKVRKKD